MGDQVTTKVKCIHMEKTILALCLNASTYLPRIQANLDALCSQPKISHLLFGGKSKATALLMECCPAAVRVGVLVRDCNRAGRDQGTGKNALAVLESCLLVMLSFVGTQWENMEYMKTLVFWLHGRIGIHGHQATSIVRNMGRPC